MLESSLLQLDLASLPGEISLASGVMGRDVSKCWASESPALLCLKAQPALCLQPVWVAECASKRAAEMADLKGRFAFELVHRIPWVAACQPRVPLAALPATSEDSWLPPAGPSADHMASRLLANSVSSVVPAGYDPSGQGPETTDGQPIWSASRHR